MTDAATTVFVVDDDEAIRRSLRLLLGSVGLEVECFAAAADFLESYDPEHPGCLLLDVRLPVTSGLDLQGELNARHSILPVIFLTGHADVPLAVRAMQAGAFNFLEKPFNDQELIDCTHAALEHDAANREALTQRRAIIHRRGRLTPRERQVLALVVEGHANKVVAAELGISERTVEIHRARVMEKMRATSLAHLVRMCLLAGDGSGGSAG